MMFCLKWAATTVSWSENFFPAHRRVLLRLTIAWPLADWVGSTSSLLTSVHTLFSSVATMLKHCAPKITWRLLKCCNHFRGCLKKVNPQLMHVKWNVAYDHCCFIYFCLFTVFCFCKVQKSVAKNQRNREITAVVLE